MIKRIAVITTTWLLISLPPAYACPLAVDVANTNFCTSFQQVAQCHCVAHGLPARMCSDLNIIYQRMLIVYGSLEQACLHQTDTNPQSCIDSWNCYRHGGVSSDNQLCSSTGSACA